MSISPLAATPRWGGRPRLRMWSTLCVAAWAWVCLAVSPVAADVFEWTDPVNGDFSTAGNWTLVSGAGPPPPGTGDEARFNEAGTYTVNFLSTVKNDLLEVSAGDVTFRSLGTDESYLLGAGPADAVITGGILSLGALNDPLDLEIGDDLTVNIGGQLNIGYGSKVTTEDLLFGTSGAGGVIIVGGTGSSIGRTGTSTTTIGQNGATGLLRLSGNSTGDINGLLLVTSSVNAASAGIVDVWSGATLQLDNLTIGGSIGSTATGTVTVDGSGSEITQTGASTLSIGQSTGNVGTLNVTGLGEYNTGSGTTTIRATGTLSVGSGTFNAGGDIDLVGGTIERTTTAGTLNLGGHTLTASADAQIDLVGDYTINGGATVNVQDGADLEFGSGTDYDIDVGTATSGTLLVDGSSSTLVTGRDTPASVSEIGSQGGTGVVTISNDASVWFGHISVAGDSASGSTGTLNIDEDCSVYANSLVVGGDGDLGAAEVNIGGTTTYAYLSVQGDGTTPSVRAPSAAPGPPRSTSTPTAA